MQALVRRPSGHDWRLVSRKFPGSVARAVHRLQRAVLAKQICRPPEFVLPLVIAKFVGVLLGEVLGDFSGRSAPTERLKRFDYEGHEFTTIHNISQAAQRIPR